MFCLLQASARHPDNGSEPLNTTCDYFRASVGIHLNCCALFRHNNYPWATTTNVKSGSQILLVHANSVVHTTRIFMRICKRMWHLHTVTKHNMSQGNICREEDSETHGLCSPKLKGWHDLLWVRKATVQPHHVVAQFHATKVAHLQYHAKNLPRQFDEEVSICGQFSSKNVACLWMEGNERQKRAYSCVDIVFVSRADATESPKFQLEKYHWTNTFTMFVVGKMWQFQNTIFLCKNDAKDALHMRNYSTVNMETIKDGNNRVKPNLKMPTNDAQTITLERLKRTSRHTSMMQKNGWKTQAKTHAE